MNDIKLPLKRYARDASAFVCWVCDADATELERAYAELQGRCNKMCEAHDRAESERLAAIGHQMQSEKERGEAYAALASARNAAADIAKVHAREVYLLTKRAVNWEKSHAGQLQNTMAFAEDLERVTKERDEARAEVARLKRIEAALCAHLQSLGSGDGAHYSTIGDTLRKVLAGIGPDGEVKP